MLRQSPREGFGGIAFLHTAPGHVATFGVLMTELAPNVPVRQTVRADLLDAVVQGGGLTDAVIAQARADLAELAANGARVVVCTCLTIGPCVDAVGVDAVGVDEAGAAAVAPPFPGAQFLRIDAAMAQAAARLPGRVLVAATVEASLASSCRMIERAGRPADSLEPLLIRDAWPLFEAGERAAYQARVIEAVRCAVLDEGRAEAVVLAQASMAPALAGLHDLEGGHGIPVLSSPRLGVAAAVAAWRAT